MTTHIIGAGLAGLAAALRLAPHTPVTLHDSAPVAGGRCRALPDGTDNGTHALLGTNRAAFRFLERIGARQGWVEPEPAGLPVFDVADGSARRVSLSPLGWGRADRRPDGFSWGGVAALARMALPVGDGTVARAMAAHPAFLRGFVDPLTVAALNTPSHEASARRLGQVLRRMGAPGAARLFVAEHGLGPDLVEPALRALRALGAEVRFGDRLRRIERTNRRATALILHEGDVVLGPGDTVVLALPPWEAVRLLTHVAAPDRHAPIVNLHFAHAGRGPVRFLGFVGGLCQWVLVRPGGVSVTVSAGDAEAEEPVETLAPRAWAEIVRAARGFGVAGDWPDAVPPCRAVKERRATPRHLPGPVAAPARLHLENLALAGDWTWPGLPATIEASVLSGEAAAAALAKAAPGAASGEVVRGAASDAHVPDASPAANVPDAASAIHRPGAASVTNAPSAASAARVPGVAAAIHRPGAALPTNAPGGASAVRVSGGASAVRVSGAAFAARVSGAAFAATAARAAAPGAAPGMAALGAASAAVGLAAAAAAAPGGGCSVQAGEPADAADGGGSDGGSGSE